MSISTLVDRVKIVVLSSGTGPFELGAAVPAYRGIEALIDGATYSYATESGSNYEAGTCVYNAGTNSLIRTPTISSNGGATVAFPANIEIVFTALAADIAPPGALPIVQTTGNATDKAMSQNATTTQLDTKATIPVVIAQGGTGAMDSAGASFNILQRALLSSDAVLAVLTKYGLETSAGTFTLTLPALSDVSPRDWIELYDVDFDAATNNVTIAAAGSDTISLYGSAASTQTLNVSGVRALLVAKSSTWSMIV